MPQARFVQQALELAGRKSCNLFLKKGVQHEQVDVSAESNHQIFFQRNSSASA